MTVIGVDPGKTGALAALDGTNLIKAIPMPLAGKKVDGAEIRSFLRDVDATAVFVEQVGTRPGQGVTSMFNFGVSYGTVLGVVQGLLLPLYTVTPQAWKRVVLGGTKKDKDAAITHCRRVFPRLELVPPRCRTPHDGMADAVCIALYGRKHLVSGMLG